MVPMHADPKRKVGDTHIDRSDEDLMVAYQNGNIAAFDSLYGRYQNRLYRYFMLKFLNAAMASELFQESFLRVHKARHSFVPDRKFSTWIFSIAANLHKDELRRRTRRPGDVNWKEVEDSALQNQSRTTIEDEFVSNENIKLLMNALEKIPEDQKDVILLHKFEDMSFPEIAEVTGMKTEAVKSKAFRGYKNLKKLILDDSKRKTS
jgi:RNA polymerase sigma-70 factor, ECF subfamily